MCGMNEMSEVIVATETPTNKELGQPTMSAMEFELHVSDLHRQDQWAEAQAIGEFGGATTPVSYAVMEMGGLLSKWGAKKRKKLTGNEYLWDNAPRLHSPRHNKIYDLRGEMPDLVASNLHDEGLIAHADVNTMWNALESESRSSHWIMVGDLKE